MFLYQGLSMWPCFQEGDLLEIEPLTIAETLRIGDCVIWRDQQGGLVVHRIVATRGGLQTRGDSMKGNDRQDHQACKLLGRVVKRYRLGRASRVAGGNWGRVAALFYRYAGRLDPERDACGGRLARGIRTLCAPLVRPLLKRERQLSVGGPDQGGLIVWKLGEVVLAVKDPCSGQEKVPWPWRLIMTVPPE